MIRFFLFWLFSLPVLAAEPRLLSWPELVPEGFELAAPEPTHLGDDEFAPPAEQQGRDAPVVHSLDQQQIRLPGYIVPLEFAADGSLSSFFLVPYYGACIHVPPPPANQIIYAQSAPGFQQSALWQPYWVEGRLSTQPEHQTLASAGYRLSVSRIEQYSLSTP